jgi:hypothetical protein
MKKIYILFYIILSTLFFSLSAKAQYIQSITENVNEYSYFGQAIVAEDEFLFIGAPYYQNNGVTTGAVFVYMKDGKNWALFQKIVTNFDDDNFGASIEYYHDHSDPSSKPTLVVGSPNRDFGIGTVYVFEFRDEDDVENSKWELKAELSPPSSQFQNFGRSISIDKDLIVIGAPYYENSNGIAYTFRKIDEQWKFESTINPPSQQYYQYFGWKVKAFNSRVFISAIGDTQFGNYTGAIYEYENKGANGYEVLQKFQPDFGEGYFGYSFDIVDDYMAVGSPGANNFIGQVEIFDISNGSPSLVDIFSPQQATEWTIYGLNLYFDKYTKNLMVKGNDSADLDIYKFINGDKRWNYQFLLVGPDEYQEGFGTHFTSKGNSYFVSSINYIDYYRGTVFSFDYNSFAQSSLPIFPIAREEAQNIAGIFPVDINNDNDYELFFSRTNASRQLLYRRNNESWEQAQAGNLVGTEYNASGAAWGDYDNDGILDVYLPNSNGKNVLYRGLSADFEEVTGIAIVDEQAPSTSAAWGDFDNDGFLDLYIGVAATHTTLLYKNDGKGNFIKIEESPVIFEAQSDVRHAEWLDYNNDGRLDLFVLTSAGAKIFRNVGNGVFQNGPAFPLESSYYSAWGDYNNDGFLDLLITGESVVYLYQNRNGNEFILNNNIQDSFSKEAYYNNPAFKDLNNDGFLDIVLFSSTGDYPGVYLQNLKNGSFESTDDIFEVIRGVDNGRIVDLNNDGMLDIIYNKIDAGRGNSPEFYYGYNNETNWAKIKLKGLTNKFGVGAKVELTSGTIGKQVRHINNLDYFAHFGLGSIYDENNIEQVSITWPSGRKTLHSGYANNTIIEIQQPENNAPNNISLTNQAVQDQRTIGTLIGIFNVADADIDSHTLQLVNGEGSEGNAGFFISNNRLWTAVVFDYNVQNQYSVRVRATDLEGAFVEKVFIIEILDRRPTSGSEGNILAKQILSEGNMTSNEYGRRVLLADDFMFVGANLDVTGSVYIYKRNLEEWELFQKIIPAVGANGENFGFSMDYYYDPTDENSVPTLVVGAMVYDQSKGRAYVYEYNGNEWVEKAVLAPTNITADNFPFFGYAVSIEGNKIVIGAPYFSGMVDGDGSDVSSRVMVGAVFEYQKSGTNWVLTRKIQGTLSDRAHFGWSVDLNKSDLVIGARQDFSNIYNQTNYGAVYHYTYNSDNSLQLNQKINTNFNERGKWFGYATRILGDYLFTSAPYKLVNGVNSVGAVYLYKRGYDDKFTLIQTFEGNGTYGFTYGWSVQIDKYNKNLYLGGRSYDYVDIFKYDPTTDHWELFDFAAGTHRFGDAITSKGNQFAVGSPKEINDFKGEVYYYNEYSHKKVSYPAFPSNKEDYQNITGIIPIDYNNDNQLDLFYTRMGPNRQLLYKNNGSQWEVKQGIDLVTTAFNATGAAWGDYNNDGILDVYLTIADGNNALFKGTLEGFEEVQEVQIVEDASRSTCAAWGDFNNDGFLDLFVGVVEGQKVLLYQNNGDETFTAVDNLQLEATSTIIQAQWLDYNNDGLIDLFINTRKGVRIYTNIGNGNFEIGFEYQIDYSNGSSWGDYNNDLLLDLLVTSDNAVYLFYNSEEGLKLAENSGIQNYIPEGVHFSDPSIKDLNNDGYQDIVLFSRSPNHESIYLINNRDATFSKTNEAFELIRNVENANIVDLNNDGSLDILYSRRDLFGGNVTQFYHAYSNESSWSKIKLKGLVNKFGVGAKVELKSTVLAPQVRHINNIDYAAHFGLGGEYEGNSIEEIMITWPSGRKTLHSGYANNTIIEIEQPENNAPTAIELNNNSVFEKQPDGTLVGELIASDPDIDSHSFELVAGEGSEGNSAFYISSNKLYTSLEFDYDVQRTYNIRVKATDLEGGIYEEQLIIIIEIPDEAPTGIQPNYFSIHSSTPENTLVGNLTSIDRNQNDFHTYSLESNDNFDNQYFFIEGNSIVLAKELTEDRLYAIKVRTTDRTGELNFIETIIIEPHGDNTIGFNSERNLNVVPAAFDEKEEVHIFFSSRNTAFQDTEENLYINFNEPQSGGLIGVYNNFPDGTHPENVFGHIPVVRRLDSKIAFNWEFASPDLRITPDNFAVKWTGKIISNYSEAITFYLNSDDGSRLWIDNKIVIDNFNGFEGEGTIELMANKEYDIKIEFFEAPGLANINLSWQSASIPLQIVPSSHLIPDRSIYQLKKVGDNLYRYTLTPGSYFDALQDQFVFKIENFDQTSETEEISYPLYKWSGSKALEVWPTEFNNEDRISIVFNPLLAWDNAGVRQGILAPAQDIYAVVSDQNENDKKIKLEKITQDLWRLEFYVREFLTDPNEGVHKLAVFFENERGDIQAFDQGGDLFHIDFNIVNVLPRNFSADEKIRVEYNISTENNPSVKNLSEIYLHASIYGHEGIRIRKLVPDNNNRLFTEFNIRAFFEISGAEVINKIMFHFGSEDGTIISSKYTFNVSETRIIDSRIFWVEPEFPSKNEPLTIFINTQNSPLESQEGPFYLWTWSPSDPVAGNGEWADSNEEMVFTKLEDYKWSKTFVPNDFYIDPSGSNDVKFLVKNKNGSAKTQDLFFLVGETPGDFIMNFISPSDLNEGGVVVSGINQAIPIKIKLSEPGKVTLYLGNSQIHTSNEKVSDFEYFLYINEWGNFPLTVVADNESKVIEKVFQIYIKIPGPTSITLSSNTVKENKPSDTFIGSLSSLDELDDFKDHEFSLVEGEGSEDNDSFNIIGMDLFSSKIFNRAQKEVYSIRIRSTNNLNQFIETIFLIDILPNAIPEDILISRNWVRSGTVGAEIGLLMTVDADENDSHTYEIEEGGNNFYIDENNVLRVRANFEVDQPVVFRVRVRTTDLENNSFVKVLDIRVLPPNRVPVDFGLTGDNSVPQNVDPGALIGSFFVIDPDEFDSHTYELVAVDQVENDDKFYIEFINGEYFLLSGVVFNADIQDSYSVDVKVIDSEGASLHKAFIINISRIINNPPSELTLNNTIVLSGLQGLIGTFETVDEDENEFHTFSLVADESGNSFDNGFFTIDENDNLVPINALVYSSDKDVYRIRVRVADKVNNILEEEFDIRVVSYDLSNSTIGEEFPAGTEVGQLNITDNVSDPTLYSFFLLSHQEEFELSEGNIIRNRITLPNLANYDLLVELRYHEQVLQKQFRIIVTPQKPTLITLNNRSEVEIDEVLVPNQIIGVLFTQDPNNDEGENHSYSITGGDDAAFFKIGDNENKDKLMNVSNLVASASKSSYRVIVRSTDKDGLFIEREFVVRVFDITKPVIGPITQESFQNAFNNNTTVSISVSDNVGVTSTKIYFRAASVNTDWTSETAGTQNIQKNFAAYFSNNDFAMQFKFEASDAAGNVAETPVFIISRKLASQPLGTVKNGTTANDFEIIAVPLKLPNPAASQVFSSLGAYDKSKWRLFGYQSSAVDFNEYNPTSNNFNIETGKGYFIISKDPVNVVFENGNPVANSVDNPYEIVLKPGWNLIGNPYLYNVLWTDVIAASNLTNLNLIIFEGGYQSSSGKPDFKLKKFRGGFVRNTGQSDINLKIPALINQAAQTGRYSSESTARYFNALSDEDWEVDFTISNSELTYSLSGIGMHPKAIDGEDFFDIATPPRLGEYLEMYTHTSDAKRIRLAKDIVPVRDNHIWEFTVDASKDSDFYSLKWENEYFGNNDKQLYLYDPELYKIINMREVKEYKFKSTDKKRFKVYFGNGEFIENNLLPDQVVSITAYPNPFGSSINIPYALNNFTDKYKVRLSIYDMMGREVAELVNDEQKPGFYEMTWDAKDKRGAIIRTGIYLYRLNVSGDGFNKEFTGKIIKN